MIQNYTQISCGLFETQAVSEKRSDEGWADATMLWNDWMQAWDGMSMNERKALKISAVYRAIDLISNGVAVLPVDIFRRDRSQFASRSKATDHPASFLLNCEPNAWQTPFEMNKTLMTQVLLRGNAYIYIFRNKEGNPQELRLLPDNTFPDWYQGDVWYFTDIGTPDNPQWAKVPDGDVIHVRGLSTEGLLGLSVIDLASETLRKTKSREVFAQKFYKNGAMPSGVLECDNDKPLSDESYKRLQKTFIESHTGLTNAGKPMILEGGMKYHALTMTLKDTEFIEQEEFDLLTIANWFGLTPDQLGYPKGSQSYSSLEIMTQRHLDNAINPWLTRIEQAYTQKLLSREEKQGGVFVEFDRAAAIRMDSETKSRSISLNVQAGVLSTNEGREQLGLPPRTDGLGDFYIMPLNMSFADQRKDLAAAQIEKMRIGINPHEVKNSETNIPPKEEDRSMTNVIDDYRNRANRYISNTIKRVSKSPERLQEWLESGWRDTRDAVQEEFQPLEKAGLLDAAESATKLIEPYLSEWRTKNEA